MEALKKGFREGKKRANIEKVISILEEAKTDEDKKKAAEYMNKNEVTIDDVKNHMQKLK